MSKNSKIFILLLLITSLIVSFNNIKSDFKNVDYFETKNDGLDESLYIEISESNDVDFIKQKFKELVNKKKKYRKDSSKVFANQFQYELIQMIILIILTIFVSYKLFRKRE